jgi:hypothetical protein
MYCVSKKCLVKLKVGVKDVAANKNFPFVKHQNCLVFTHFSCLIATIKD